MKKILILAAALAVVLTVFSFPVVALMFQIPRLPPHLLLKLK